MSNPLRLALDSLRSFIDYPLRQAFRWQRPGLQIPNEPKQALFATLPPSERSQAAQLETDLRATYHLQALYEHSTCDNYRENLFYLELLSQAFTLAQVHLPENVQAADIGPSHWFYVQGLLALLRYWQDPTGRQVGLSGYERDAYRVYGDLRSRRDHAHAHMRARPELRYVAGAFTARPAAFDLITLLFPFVFVADHLSWGLPPNLFRPAELMRIAWDSLKPGGYLLVANQGQAEHETQLRQWGDLGIPLRAAFQFSSLFYRYELERFVILTQRPHAYE